MLRPFKTVEELTQETGLCLEKSIVMRTKKADERACLLGDEINAKDEVKE